MTVIGKGQWSQQKRNINHGHVVNTTNKAN